MITIKISPKIPKNKTGNVRKISTKGTVIGEPDAAPKKSKAGYRIIHTATKAPEVKKAVFAARQTNETS